MVSCCWSQKHDAPSIAAGNRVADVRDLYRQTFVSKTATSPPIAWPRPRRSPVGEFLKFARVLRSVGCAEGAPARCVPGSREIQVRGRPIGKRGIIEDRKTDRDPWTWLKSGRHNVRRQCCVPLRLLPRQPSTLTAVDDLCRETLGVSKWMPMRFYAGLGNGSSSLARRASMIAA